MTDFMHCNNCYILPSKGTNRKYFLTSCFHILCQSCVQHIPGNPMLCPVCNHEMKSLEINSAMDPNLQELFKREKLTQLMKYCQRQTQISKEQAKEVEELKEWIRTAEIKMKESEEEKANLLRELEDIKKLTNRFDKDIAYDSAIEKMFTDCHQRNSKCDDSNISEGRSNLSFNKMFLGESKTDVPSFLQTNPEEDGINSSMNSVGRSGVVSPQASMSSSVVSELTTPKMLGLPKKGLSHSGGNVYTARRTPSKDNPYAGVFCRPPVLQKYNGRYSAGKSAVVTSAICTVPRLQAKSPNTPGYVTRGKIIPRANTLAMEGDGY
ncbi:unnamed protein product [Cylicocyclus nassatus]|uniref:RING-type domain-containing protein n=1 Tax=Cylicocyclus nassatus TaxID=53992 RepID=A0AA36LYZ3_CYLNA|nr:unnamed protein product [Cylicocyclus nassatus]